MSTTPSPYGCSVEPAIAFAAELAKQYAAAGGDPVDLFAAFVGIVVEQDKKIGLAALEATDRFLIKSFHRS